MKLAEIYDPTDRTMETRVKIPYSVRNGRYELKAALKITDNMVDNGIFCAPLAFAPKIIVDTKLLSSLENFPLRLGEGNLDSNNHLAKKKVLENSRKFALEFHEYNDHITTLEFFPEITIGSLFLQKVTHLNLARCNKYMKEVHGIISLSDFYKGPVLSLLLVKGLKALDISRLGSAKSTTDVEKIINNHLGKDGDILECQEELITAGCKEYAKL